MLTLWILSQTTYAILPQFAYFAVSVFGHVFGIDSGHLFTLS